MIRPGPPGEQRAQQRFDTTSRAASFYANQMLDHLNADMQRFIARQEMAYIATADASGACDCSFRAGVPGFVHVLDHNRLAYPEYRGNGVLASVGNIMENPHIGMIFLDYFQSTVGLHVNGNACVLSPDDVRNLPHVSTAMLAATLQKGGRRPEAWIIVDVKEAYIHCSKHVPLLTRLEKPIAWGTDDDLIKGGDFFRAKPDRRS